MKKSLIIIAILLLIVIIICAVGILMNSKKVLLQKQENKEYEKYLNNDIYGTDVVTLINKAIDNNNKNNVSKNSSGKYIENNENSIIIDLVMIINEEKEKIKTYRMETIDKVGISEFIANFNTAKFRITKIEYHEQTGMVKYIEISQQYE